MSKQVRWLLHESESWVSRGLISASQAEQIRQLYPKPAALPWGTILFSGLGAIIAGLGVILLLAYNWQAIPREIKLLIVLSAVGILHAAGGWLFLRTDWRRQLGEAISLLGTMMFGAGIWLVAQAYHIQEHFPHGFLIWGLGAMAMAWAMPSIAQAAVGIILLAIWGCTESWGFRGAVHWAPILIFLTAAPLAWRFRSPFLVSLGLLAILINLLAAISVADEGLVVKAMLQFCVAVAGLGILASKDTRFPQSAAPLSIIGWAGTLFCMFLLSFSGIVDDLLGWDSNTARHEMERQIYGWGAFSLALAVWAAIAWRWRESSASQRAEMRVENWLLPLSAFVVQALTIDAVQGNETFVAGIFNLVLLAIVASWMARGIIEGELRPMVLGSLLLSVLVFARYFDLFESLAMRGAAFLLLGLILFVQGILFRRTRQRLVRISPHPLAQ